MSLYFNWSCDFQRFTKSKNSRNFRFALQPLFISNKILSTSLFNLQGANFPLPSAENCTACRFHQEIDQGTQNALAFCPPKVSDAVSLTACLLYQMKFRLSRTFSKLFRSFLNQFFQNSNFSDRRLFRNSLFIISNRNPFVKNFFRSFQAAFPFDRRASQRQLNRIPQREAGVNNNFQFFSYFLKLVVFCFLCYNKYRTLRTKPQRCLYLP